MKILHVDSSILGDRSVSRILSAEIIAKLKVDLLGAVVSYRDLAERPPTHLSGAYLSAASDPNAEHTPVNRADVEEGALILREFVTADVVVLGVALYNFTVPSALKAWIDRVVVAGTTFRYTADGRAEGLAGGKRVIIAIARGGIYGPGSPIQSFEHGETYLRVVFGFIGIHDITVVTADGLAMGPEQRQRAIERAREQISELAA